jgi:transposase
MSPPHYPSDLSDAEWAILQPLLSSGERRGRPPKWPQRHVADAVFYLLRSGCSWRWADGAYTGGFREWLRRRLGWRLEVPHHSDWQLWRYGLEEKPRGFQVLPRRWVVEIV